VPNACGSPRFCAECFLQKRARRIQRWREAGTPKVGLFYVIDRELWLDSTPIPEARQLREVIIPSGNHRSYWANLRRIIRALAGVPHICYPRNRVVFVKAMGRYHLYLGPELFTHEPLIWQVIDVMHLPPAQAEVRLTAPFRIQQFP
jgi:hypothetical protein